MAQVLASSSRCVARPCAIAGAEASTSVRPVAMISRRAAVPRAPVSLPLTTIVEVRGTLICRASGAVASSTPSVKIDNISDPFATVLTIEFTGQSASAPSAELLDAVSTLKNLGLNIRRAKVKGGSGSNTFFITDADTSEKIVKSARLEDIRMTVLNSLSANQQEVAEARAAAANLSDSEPKVLGTRRKVVQTTIDVSEASNGSCSVLKITTKDRPGLLVDIVRVLKDINLNVVSAEIETEGALATDEFFITYHGEPLSSPMVTLVTNSLQYYLSLAEVAKEESY
ncbi:hypothetical protein HYH03_012805 [Edaphochlamys debaryana]|uniref:ACT domain-containing protein n=1 Tax=Edaphochlamys debaryana TaxID=47281 RepID=A0A836BU15_9CHLO|nr:hypothetical protein HYH03_012805 [Edaphochlamys debaryana]|eukprot:KAG2488637.1 hypothetical protein HYH03_012805 [Edaphochlamys debaryana]